jgi:hypothetical protein
VVFGFCDVGDPEAKTLESAEKPVENVSVADVCPLLAATFLRHFLFTNCPCGYKLRRFHKR